MSVQNDSASSRKHSNDVITKCLVLPSLQTNWELLFHFLTVTVLLKIVWRSYDCPFISLASLALNMMLTQCTFMSMAAIPELIHSYKTYLEILSSLPLSWSYLYSKKLNKTWLYYALCLSEMSLRYFEIASSLCQTNQNFMVLTWPWQNTNPSVLFTI